MNLSNSRVFVLSLKRSKERLAQTIVHLRSNGVLAEVFLGLDARTCGLSTRHVYDRDHPEDNYTMGSKEIAMFLSHYMLWRACYYIDAETFVVMEDDVRLVEGWREQWDYSMQSIPHDWDLLYIGSCCCDAAPGKEQIAGSLWRVTSAQCTHAYAFKKRALPLMISACDKVEAPIDITMALRMIPHLNTFAFLPRLAVQDKTEIPP